MNIAPLLQELKQIQSPYVLEQKHIQRTIELMEEYPTICTARQTFAGHLTASVWITSPDRQQILLLFHRKLGFWLQPGGHVESTDQNMIAAAWREAKEETGLTSLSLVSEQVFDVDVHPIPANAKEPQHNHHDIRFLFEADPSEALVISKESKALEWVDVKEVASKNDARSVLRMLEKSNALVTSEK